MFVPIGKYLLNLKKKKIFAFYHSKGKIITIRNGWTIISKFLNKNGIKKMNSRSEYFFGVFAIFNLLHF